MRRDLIPRANSSLLDLWTGTYVRGPTRRRSLSDGDSTLAVNGHMRKLRHSERTQASRSGPALVARLKSAVFGFGRHAPCQLGRRDGREDTETPRPRGGYQLHGREQARRGDARERVGRRIYRRMCFSPTETRRANMVCRSGIPAQKTPWTLSRRHSRLRR